VIWQLASAKREADPKNRDSADPKASPPRLELTYGLDSSMAQRLQDCYGQLAQLGYKIAGLETVRVAPEKSAGKRESPKPVPGASTSATKPVMAEKAAAEAPQPAEPAPSPRKARPKPETNPSPAIPAAPAPGVADRNPAFLPGL